MEKQDSSKYETQGTEGISVSESLSERLVLRIFDGVGIPSMPTGSAIFGTGEVANDLDYICLDRGGLFTALHDRGWETGATQFEDGIRSGDGKFVSFKKGFVNLILGNEDFVYRWILAHDSALENPHLTIDRDSRIDIFKKFGF
jgi:hypothetical protein